MPCEIFMWKYFALLWNPWSPSFQFEMTWFYQQKSVKWWLMWPILKAYITFTLQGFFKPINIQFVLTNFPFLVHNWLSIHTQWCVSWRRPAGCGPHRWWAVPEVEGVQYPQESLRLPCAKSRTGRHTCTWELWSLITTKGLISKREQEEKRLNKVSM